MASRVEMENVLKTICVPRLRAEGFSGTFPHLRRLYSEGGDLISFQFNRNGGSFIVEITKCAAAGVQSPVKGLIQPAKATAQDRHPNNRFRITPPDDDWFRFTELAPEPIAAKLAAILLSQATWDTLSSEGTETPYARR